MKPLTWVFWQSNRLGARISPLHGRFPIDIRSKALEEAAELTAIRVKVTNGEAAAGEHSAVAAPMPGD